VTLPKPPRRSRRATLQTAATAVGGLLGIDALFSAGPATAAAAPFPEAPKDMIERGFKVAAGDTRADQHFQMKGVTANTLDVKVSGADSGGRLAMLEQIGQSPNGGPPRHLHAEQDEFFYAVEGRYRFEVGGERFELGPGDSIFAPRGVPHGFIQLTPTARLMLAYQPAGQIEAFFRATAAWEAPPSPDEVKAVFAAHGMTVVGPPLSPE
jgi:quercetin dioxygenase-like cupin family protein